MHSLPHAVDVGAQAPAPTLHDLHPLQHAALLRWHNTRAISDVVDDLQAHPAFPLIDGNPTCCAATRLRRKPAHAPQGGAA